MSELQGTMEDGVERMEDIQSAAPSPVPTISTLPTPTPTTAPSSCEMTSGPPSPEKNGKSQLDGQGQSERNVIQLDLKTQLLRRLAGQRREIAEIERLVAGSLWPTPTLKTSTVTAMPRFSQDQAPADDVRIEATTSQGTRGTSGRFERGRDPDVVELTSSDDNDDDLGPKRSNGNGTRGQRGIKRGRQNPPTLPQDSEAAHHLPRLRLEMRPMLHGYLLEWFAKKQPGRPVSPAIDYFEVYYSSKNRNDGKVVEWKLLEKRSEDSAMIGSLRPELRYFFAVRANYEDGLKGYFSNVRTSD